MSSANHQQDKLFEEICSQNQGFEHYENMFQAVLMELESDDVLETFRREYDSLHNSFTKCHEGEKRLIKKCTDLASEINSCILKVRSAEELSQGDQATIEQLKKEIVKAKNKIAQSKETEVTLKEKIKQLKVDIKELDKQVDRGAAGIVGHDTTILDLTRVRADLQKEHDTQRSQVIALQHEISYLEGRVSKATDEKNTKESDLRALRDAIELKNAELEQQRDRKHNKERELKTIKEDLGRRNKSISENQQGITILSDEIKKLDDQLMRVREEADKVSRDYTALTKQLHQAQHDLHDCGETNEQLQKDIHQEAQQLKLKDGEVSGLHREQVKQNKLVEAIEKRNTVLESQRSETEIQRNSLRIEIQQRELDIANLSKQAESDRKQIEDLARERDILNKNYLKAQSATQRQKDWLAVKENQKRNLEHQIRAFERHTQLQSEMIHQLTKEALAYEQEANDAAIRCAKALDEVKMQEQLTVDEQKKIQDAEGKLKQQQNMLETVLNERNLYAKNYNQLRTEITEMGRRFKIMLNQIKQLKEEIQSKERELVSEEALVNTLTKERKDHEIHIDAMKKKTEKRERTVEAYNVELHKLNQIIADADAEKNRQRRDHVNVMNERDILGTQLIKRNDELAQLYEKIRIQQSMLKKGEAQYNDRLRDIQQLDFRITQLSEELEKMKAFAARVPDLRLHLNKATRELTREQCRVRSLLDEADNPLNVHRLHKLEWSEPQTFELHERVRQLQRELVQRNNEVEEKERLIADKEKLYVELKSVIARQPGPEVAEQLNVYQDSLQKKSGQMRAMKLSLRHFQEQVEQYKSRYEELSSELDHLTKVFVSKKKGSSKAEENHRIINEMLGRPADAPPDAPQESVYVGYTAPPRPQSPSAVDVDGIDPMASLDGTLGAASGAAGLPTGEGDEDVDVEVGEDEEVPVPVTEAPPGLDDDEPAPQTAPQQRGDVL
jgi:chromosome segregation ATPase